MAIRLFIFTVLVIAGLMVAAPVQAEIVSAGEPSLVRVERAPDYIFPDIYQRQLAYRETLLVLQDDLRDRQKAFVAPSLEAQEIYAQDLEALHSIIGE